jgi:hypothetical protein
MHYTTSNFYQLRKPKHKKGLSEYCNSVGSEHKKQEMTTVAAAEDCSHVFDQGV